MSYQSDLKKHLATHKRDVLGIAEAGLWRGMPYDHILPVELRSKNLFDEAAGAEAFLARSPEKRHKDFHHLNSSQAFAFNLFFPFFDRKPDGAQALLRALGQGGALTRWEVEAIPDANEGSNLDVVWRTADDVRTVCEVKLSENEFGMARDDDAHRKKLDATYALLLAAHLTPESLAPAAFFRAYQIYRNVWHMTAHPNGRLLFLLPRANGGLWRRLHAALGGVVPATRSRVAAVAIEDVITALQSDMACPEDLRATALKLHRKYLLVSRTASPAAIAASS